MFSLTSSATNKPIDTIFIYLLLVEALPMRQNAVSSSTLVLSFILTLNKKICRSQIVNVFKLYVTANFYKYFTI